MVFVEFRESISSWNPFCESVLITAYINDPLFSCHFYFFTEYFYRCLLTFTALFFSEAYVTDDLKNQHDQIPWQEIANMRNILAHQYFNVDIEKVEKVVKQDLPKLKIQIQEILKYL